MAPFAALADDPQDVVTALEPEIVDVSVQRFGHPEPVQGEQRGQGVFAMCADTGPYHERTQLVAIQAQGPGLVVNLRATDVGGGAAVDVSFLFTVPMEAGQRRESSGDGGGHEPSGFHGPAEQLEVGSLDLKQGEAVVPAPVGEQSRSVA